jgi:hypothetical protein
MEMIQNQNLYTLIKFNLEIQNLFLIFIGNKGYVLYY